MRHFSVNDAHHISIGEHSECCNAGTFVSVEQAEVHSPPAGS